MVRQEAQQVELLEQPDDALAVGDDQAVHLVLDHQRQRIEQRRVGRDGHQLEGGEVAHRQRCRAARPSTTARCSPVLVKMPSRSPSRTSTLLVRCACISAATGDDAGRAVDDMRRPQERLVDTRDIVSACISRWLWRCASAPSLFDRSENSSAPKVALPEISALTAALRKLVGHHLLGGDEAAAGAARSPASGRRNNRSGP